ncbi:MAG: hypothetical protein LBR06_00615 [Bacteroidales bacterium]|jgi:hypothetical protein|nr:hypothetical protein [Bacteroidales bacterium]
MTWYELLLIASGVLFLLTTLGSLLFGDVSADADIEVGVDGFLMSDIISFKGCLHFLLGFSLTLTLMREVTLLTVSVATVVGLVFTFTLYYIYKLIYSKLQQSLHYTDEITEMDAEVYFWNEAKKIGEVFITLEGRPVTVTLQGAEGMNLEKGQKIKVSGTRKAVFPVEFIV